MVRVSSPPQSRSKAVVCVSTPRKYPRSGYFLVTLICNKAYGDDEVLDMDCNDFDENTWGRALLCPNRHGGDNQLWKIEDGELICQHEGARLEISIYTVAFLHDPI